MRAEIRDAQRVVIKVGSSCLTLPNGSFNHNRVHELAEIVSRLHSSGKLVVLVTSGAIAAAIKPLGLTGRPRDLETQQAAAAVGQGLLIRHYTEAFAQYGVRVAQVLLTVEDVVRPSTYRNVLNTISRLFRLGVVPIVNENDTTATHEIRFGDNDRLASLVAHLVRADAMLLLTDVDGLHTAHPSEPGSELIRVVGDIADLHADTSRVGSRVGTGGMRTKVEAASIATHAGVSVVLTHADHLAGALLGEEVGTLFTPVGKRRRRKLLWLAHAAEVRGAFHIDAGALNALQEKNASLLPAGVTRVEGEFVAGDPVDIMGPDGHRIARGFTALSSHDVTQTVRMATRGSRPVVHRDALIMM